MRPGWYESSKVKISGFPQKKKKQNTVHKNTSWLQDDETSTEIVIADSAEWSSVVSVEVVDEGEHFKKLEAKR